VQRNEGAGRQARTESWICGPRMPCPQLWGRLEERLLPKGGSTRMDFTFVERRRTCLRCLCFQSKVDPTSFIQPNPLSTKLCYRVLRVYGVNVNRLLLTLMLANVHFILCFYAYYACAKYLNKITSFDIRIYSGVIEC